MTREEFDRNFAASRDNTKGFTDAQLDALNNDAFALVADMDMRDDITADHAKTVMDDLMNSVLR